MKENNIIIDEKSGFRPEHSTETILLDSTNESFGNMDKGLINGVLFLDLKKAFDTVNHKILLTKLKMYGIRGCSLEWFRSYFMNRKQVCAINGPFLLLLYINDLTLTALKQLTPCRLFADDTTLLATGLNTVA